MDTCQGQLADLLNQAGTVLLDDRPPGRLGGRSYLFSNPEDTIIAHRQSDVAPALERLDAALAAGKHVAGYLSYDAGLTLDKALDGRHTADVPLVWLGVYDDVTELKASAVDLGPPATDEEISVASLNISNDEYLDRVVRAKDYIEAGDAYQINYTCKLRFASRAPAARLFSRLRSAHPVCHSAFINTGDEQVVSLSPELFLRRTVNRVQTRPMKGTMRRGRWSEEDDATATALAADEKNCAENVMIVDLMRNDLGRVCEIGSVKAPRLFNVERYASLLQMTSDVSGRLREGVSASQLLRATFPPGSVTGAPKIHAMELIDELEAESRGVYCGAIGWFRPGGDCLLNVAIRTIVQRGDNCEMGVGSGIVNDSDPTSELAETRLKGQFLRSPPRDFRLLETMLWAPPRGYRLLEEHLERAKQSARYFGWDFTEASARRALEKALPQSAADATKPARVRLLIDANGACEAQGAPLTAPAKSEDGPRVLLSSRRIDPTDVFLFHKTTRREAYDADWRDAQARGYTDLVYQNTRGELTEGAITSIIVELDGRLYTPPLDCGLLPGTWRAARLASGDVEERVLTLDDLKRASRLMLGNSVRGAVEIARLDDNNGQVIATYEP